LDANVIEACGVTKVFRRSGVTANSNIALSVRAGEVWGLLGPNGAGKTTFVRILMGLLRPTSGSVSILGVNVLENPRFPATVVGYYGQRSLYLWSYRPRELINHTARFRGLSSREAARQTRDLMDRFNMGGIAGRLLWHLSGGQCRLVALCAALVGNPPVLVLDEPTNELDPALRQQVWGYLLELSRKDHVAILLVTHNVYEAERVLDYVAVIDAGEMKAVGTPRDLRSRLGYEVRLELKLVPGARPGDLRGLLGRPEAREIRERVWWIHSGREQLPELLQCAIAPECQRLIEDYRVVPPNLEDVYVEVTAKGWDRQ